MFCPSLPGGLSNLFRMMGIPTAALLLENDNGFPQPPPQDFHRVVHFVTKMWEFEGGKQWKKRTSLYVSVIVIVYVFV